MGYGCRRVMGLGLPLLSILTIAQFRAVLAHEFAHYYEGDTGLGPWVFKTQLAIIRIFRTLDRWGNWHGSQSWESCIG
jgi:Zn-dependent protease with chaperone function